MRPATEPHDRRGPVRNGALRPVDLIAPFDEAVAQLRNAGHLFNIVRSRISPVSVAAAVSVCVIPAICLAARASRRNERSAVNTNYEQTNESGASAQLLLLLLLLMLLPPLRLPLWLLH